MHSAIEAILLQHQRVVVESLLQAASCIIVLLGDRGPPIWLGFETIAQRAPGVAYLGDNAPIAIQALLAKARPQRSAFLKLGLVLAKPSIKHMRNGALE